MANDALVQQLMSLQLVAKEQGFSEAWAWLGKQIHELLSAQKPKRRRPRGRWVRLAATGQRVMLDARVVARALKENKEGGEKDAISHNRTVKDAENLAAERH